MLVSKATYIFKKDIKTSSRSKFNTKTGVYRTLYAKGTFIIYACESRYTETS